MRRRCAIQYWRQNEPLAAYTGHVCGASVEVPSADAEKWSRCQSSRFAARLDRRCYQRAGWCQSQGYGGVGYEEWRQAYRVDQ